MSVPREIRSLHALRAVAALFVVAFHATVLWHDRFDPAIRPWMQGNAGVDLFFVISGFIMVTSTRRLRLAPRPARRFVELRLIRIVPLYWGVTAAKLASIAAIPSLALHTRPTPGNVLASFLFLPSRDAAGVIRPVLDVGWTLSFEMLFYAVFALALAARIDPLALIAPVMAALAALSPLRPPGAPAIETLADPMVLEFLFGALLARLLERRRAPLPLALLVGALLVGIAGLLCLALLPTDGRWARALVWGTAATAALGGFVLAETAIRRWIPGALVAIGEASYSLYLTHGFVLPLVGAALARTALGGTALGVALVAASLMASLALALPVYAFVEKPITERLRRRIARPAAAASAGPAPVDFGGDERLHLLHPAVGCEEHASLRRTGGDGAEPCGHALVKDLIPPLVAIEHAGPPFHPPLPGRRVHLEDEREVGHDRQQSGERLDQDGALA